MGSGYRSSNALNADFEIIEEAINNTLSRDGTGPNQMEAELDMNSNRILNLPEPISDLEPARRIDTINLAIDAEAAKDAAEAAQAAAEQAEINAESAEAISVEARDESVLAREAAESARDEALASNADRADRVLGNLSDVDAALANLGAPALSSENTFSARQIFTDNISVGPQATTADIAQFYVSRIENNPSPPGGNAIAAVQTRLDFAPTGNSGANPDGVYGTLWYNSPYTFTGAGAAIRGNAYTIPQSGDGEVNVLNLVGVYGRGRHEAKGTVTRLMSFLADGGSFTKGPNAGPISATMGMYLVASDTGVKNYGILATGAFSDGTIAGEPNVDLSYRVTGSGAQKISGFGRSGNAVLSVVADSSAQNYGQLQFGSTAGAYGTANATGSGVVAYGCSLYLNTNTGDYRRQNATLRPSGLIFNRAGDGTAEIAFASTGTADSIIGSFTSPMSWAADGTTTIRPPATATPSNNGDLVIQATSNTSLTFKYKGSDGVVRSASLTLS